MQWLIVSFILLPLLYWKSQDYSQSIAFMSFPIVFLGYSIKNKWLGYFLIWSVISTAFYQFHIVQWESLCFIFSGALLYYIFSKHIESYYVYKWIWILVLINCIFLVFQYFNIDPIWEYHSSSPTKEIVKDRLVGIMSWQNHLGMFGAMTLPLAISRNRFMVLPCILLIYVSQSIICIIASIISTSGYFLDYFKLMVEKGKGYIPLLIFGILSIIILLNCNNKTFSIIKEKLKIRGSIYYDTLQGSFKKPIYGYGCGSWKTAKFRQRPTTSPTHKLYYDKLNCQYLRIFFEHGLIGLILIAGLIYDFFRSYSKRTKHIFYSLLSLLIIGIFQDPMNFPRISGFSIILYSIYNKEN